MNTNVNPRVRVDLRAVVRRSMFAVAVGLFAYVLAVSVYALLFARPVVPREAEDYYWRHHDTYGLPYKSRGLY